MDGTVNPALVVSQVVNGTTAGILVNVSIDGTYSLRNPADSIMSTLVSSNKALLFLDISLSTGWWRVRDALGNEITRFEVVAFGGSYAALGTSQVLLDARLVPIVFGPYSTQFMTFRSTTSPKCSFTGTSDSATISPTPGELYTMAFRSTTYAPSVIPPDSAFFRHPEDHSGVSPQTGDFWLRAEGHNFYVTDSGDTGELGSYVIFKLSAGHGGTVYVRGLCSNGVASTSYETTAVAILVNI